MAKEYLFLLPLSQRAAFATIRGGVRRGFSITRIESSVRAIGIPVGRTTGLGPVVRALRLEEEAGQAIRVLNRNQIIDTIELPQSITNIKRKYSYQFRQTGLNSGGEQIIRHVTVRTDNPLSTKGELEDLAQTALDEGDEYETLQDADLQLTFGLRRSTDF